MTAYEQCFDELGIQMPTLEQKRALHRLTAAVAPEAKELLRARLDASESRDRVKADDARVDVLRAAIERVLSTENCPRRVRRLLSNAVDATTYDGRSAQQIRGAAHA